MFAENGDGRGDGDGRWRAKGKAERGVLNAVQRSGDERRVTEVDGVSSKVREIIVGMGRWWIVNCKTLESIRIPVDTKKDHT